MATQENQLVKPVDPEIIPDTKLKGITTALYDLHVQAAKLPEIKRKLEAKEVTDSESYREVGELVQQARNIGKEGEIKMGPFKRIVQLAKDTIQGWVKNHEQDSEAVAKIGADKQAEWNKRERERKEAEQRREKQEKEAKQRREAEEQRILDEQAAKERKEKRIAEIREMLRCKEITKRVAEKLLREAGATEEADKAAAAALAEEKAAAPVTVKVKQEKPTVTGQRARVEWRFKIRDIEAIKREFLYPLPEQDGSYSVEKFPRIRDQVKATKDKDKAEAIVGGIEVWPEDKV